MERCWHELIDNDCSRESAEVERFCRMSHFVRTWLLIQQSKMSTSKIHMPEMSLDVMVTHRNLALRRLVPCLRRDQAQVVWASCFSLIVTWESENVAGC